MMNKKIVAVITVLGLFLAGSYIKDSKEQEKLNEKAKLPTIGVLQFVSHPALDDIYKGMVDSLAKEGFKDGETANIVFQNGQADQSKLTSMSQHLINEKSNILVGIATPAAQALANQTQEIPIVLGAISDPKSAGLVEDNNHPGGNITGVSDQSPVEAQLELVKEILPSSKKMGILYSSAEDNSAYQAEKITTEAKKSGFDVKSYPVPSTNEISQMMQVMSKEVDFVYLPTDNTMANAMQTIVDVANQYKIPVIPSVDTMVEQGGLATVGINQYELGVKTGEMVASILKGESKPATTPIYTFDSGDIIINQKQADFLNISINQSIKDKAIIKGGE
ncbi:tryptophan ABC transporter substrate-binding protein [Vagococcus fluvialis]|uniref:Peptide ABC transporter substrate-binding protein n=1 Tax=Vagococcus fluvialis TaxID=2738 RepID=A0A430AB65_9ENTE|nr:tryptophan ABC transporter substrate-binding protein [Vagococcus fluvialis]MBO0480496.1 ABC transporter substrate-binding protein [Vagococcus fluvialis]MBO0484807.1 ABC transporter substrate-binding protein [Vagococcus fluvialis]MBO0485900.1 ABC transporter substrate-binding protein [Vagococcus fluvialis]MDT2747339.1 tryptophan ABC transporter substrate-binding protein [Vagococcus fluvialis]RSU04436.1 peptide ABC transporter substrate-binding protein [Vagococcus fluvialis]